MPPPNCTTVNQKHLTLWGYVADPLIFVVSRQVWDSWSAEDQQAVREAALQAAAEEVALARKGISGGDDAMLKAIEANGVHVVRADGRREAGLPDGDPPGLREMGEVYWAAPWRRKPRTPSPSDECRPRNSVGRGRSGGSPPRVPLKIEEVLAAATLGLVAVITFANVLTRYFSDISFAFTEEFSICLMVMMTLFGASVAVVRDRHMRITFSD